MDTTPTTVRRPPRPARGRPAFTPAAPRHSAPQRPAFTLTELLVVIGLIVLLIAVAVPAFRAMSGGRSIDAAQNQLSAVLGAARAEAIGLQKVRGVFFYVDPATDRVNAALVEETAPPASVTAAPFPDHYLDLVPDRDPVVLPVGVGLQGIDNTELSGGKRKDDGFVGFNVGPADAIRYGGVVLFDGYGRVINKYYGFLLGRPEPGGSPTKLRTTAVAELFGIPPGDAPARFVPVQLGTSITPAPPAMSLFGFVLYDAEPFRTLGYTDGDPQYDSDVKGDEMLEEDWLDKNAAPVLINRYNGTLIRGE